MPLSNAIPMAADSAEISGAFVGDGGIMTGILGGVIIGAAVTFMENKKPKVTAINVNPTFI
jgi:hypothetical protein